MAKIINKTFLTKEDCCEILITRTDDENYLKTIVIDLDDVEKFKGKYRISLDKNNYVKMRVRGKSYLLHHLITGFKFEDDFVIDHIDGNPLNNRKDNLRKVTQRENSLNKHKSRSNIGIVGVSERSNGKYNYFRATTVTNELDKPYFRKDGRVVKRYKRISKQFNINKLGREEALKQSKQWLKEQRLKCND